MENSNTDWAYLEKFQLENEKLKSRFDENRIVFIGDSIIAGWNEHDFFKKNPNYINRGINGQTSSQILHRFQADVLDLNPKCVVVLVGTNDIAENNGPITLEQIERNFLSMITLSRKNSIKIILCSLLPVERYYWNKKVVPFERIIHLNQILNAQCDNKTVFYVDFYSSLTADKGMHTKFSEDGVHPNSYGYDVMSSILSDNLSDFS